MDNTNKFIELPSNLDNKEIILPRFLTPEASTFAECEDCTYNCITACQFTCTSGSGCTSGCTSACQQFCTDSCTSSCIASCTSSCTSGTSPHVHSGWSDWRTNPWLTPADPHKQIRTCKDYPSCNGVEYRTVDHDWYYYDKGDASGHISKCRIGGETQRFPHKESSRSHTNNGGNHTVTWYCPCTYSASFTEAHSFGEWYPISDKTQRRDCVCGAFETQTTQAPSPSISITVNNVTKTSVSASINITGNYSGLNVGIVGVYVDKNTTSKTISYSGLSPDTSYTIFVEGWYQDSNIATSTTSFRTLKETIPAKITNFSTSPSKYSVSYHIDANSETNYINFRVYGNGVDQTESSSSNSLGGYISGLSPNTSYNYKAVAGNSVGSDERSGSFTTLALQPPQISNMTALAVTYNSATVSVEFSLMDASLSSIDIEWYANGEYKLSSKDSPVIISGLQDSTIYLITCKIKSNVGNTERSVSITTLQGKFSNNLGGSGADGRLAKGDPITILKNSKWNEFIGVIGKRYDSLQMIPIHPIETLNNGEGFSALYFNRIIDNVGNLPNTTGLPLKVSKWESVLAYHINTIIDAFNSGIK